MNAGTLIIGAGQAGVQLAVSLRELWPDEPITLAGAEPHAPYQRPPLSKTFLAGNADEGSLAFRTAAFYRDRHIEVLQGERITALSAPAGASGPGSVTTGSGRTLPFDRLGLAVGARPRRLRMPGADLSGVHYLRSVDDARRLRRDLAGAHSVVVVGGGYIGLEAASAARSLGKDVTVVEAADRLIARSVAPVVSEFYRRAHERRGVGVHLGAAVAELTGDHGRVAGVELADGTHLNADLVLVGVGILPRTELAEQLGLACDGGILVDRFARTSAPSVVAAGDCTVLPSPVTGQGWVRLESVQNAVSQAKVAAGSLAGRPEPYRETPWFWSDQYDIKLQIAGLSSGYDDFVVRGDPASEHFSVLYYREGRLLAVDAINSARDYLTVRKALGQAATIPLHAAAREDTPLKELLVPAVPT